MPTQAFNDLPSLARQLRVDLQQKRFILLYAYNGTGKTRLSTEFKNLGKIVDVNGEIASQDTLYFNAFTEDLFTWDNDLENDLERVLELNTDSKFFDGLRDFSMEVKIGKLLERYTDYNFRIMYDRRKAAVPPETTETVLPPAVVFFRERNSNGAPIPIKVSRGEESLFIWCFFLAIMELAISGEEAYKWVKFIYIDDPISSLDEQNAVAVAVQLCSMIKDDANQHKTIVSSHHPLFFNVVYNELHRIKGNRFYFLGRLPATGSYSLADTSDTPFFHHVASLIQLHDAARSGQVFTHHFNMLRVLAEKTASFLGYNRFEDCIVRDENDEDGLVHKRLLNLLSHGKFSVFDPMEMVDENKRHFKKMLANFTERFVFNPQFFPPLKLDEEPPTLAATPQLSEVATSVEDSSSNAKVVRETT